MGRALSSIGVPDHGDLSANAVQSLDIHLVRLIHFDETHLGGITASASAAALIVLFLLDFTHGFANRNGMIRICTRTTEASSLAIGAAGRLASR